MDFTYTPAQRELQDTAAGLAREIMAFEDDCERDRGLSGEALDHIATRTIDAGLNAINMPAAWGGAGLSILDQAIVQEQLGQITNALWDVVWRPANALKACTRGAARAVPDPRHPRAAPRRLRGDRGGGRLGPVDGADDGAAPR